MGETRTRAVLRATLAGVLALVNAPLLAERPDVTVRIGAFRLSPEGRGSVVVEMTMGERWHVNSHTPLEDFLVPTDVVLRTPSGRELAVRYPKALQRRFAFSETPLSVYAGTVRFEAELALPPGTRRPVALSGEVSFQACTEEQCFPPERIPLAASLEVR